jgi:hypothetical protein
MTTLRDISSTEHVCWRFHPGDQDAPDHRPTFNHDRDTVDPSPSTWDSWEVEYDDSEEEPSDFMKKHGHRRIELLQHWSTHPEPTPLPRVAAPYLFKAVSDIGETLDELLFSRVEDMRGDVALCNYEMAQRTESLVRTQEGMVSTHADYPLTVAQASFAREIWEVKLRVLRAETREEARTRIVCEDQSCE